MGHLYHSFLYVYQRVPFGYAKGRQGVGQSPRFSRRHVASVFSSRHGGWNNGMFTTDDREW